MSEQNTNNDREHALRMHMELNGIGNPINNLLNNMQMNELQNVFSTPFQGTVLQSTIPEVKEPDSDSDIDSDSDDEINHTQFPNTGINHTPSYSIHHPLQHFLNTDITDLLHQTFPPIQTQPPFNISDLTTTNNPFINIFDNIMNQAQNQTQEDVPVVLTEEALDVIEKISYTELIDKYNIVECKDDACTICMEPYEITDENISVMPCKHYFHFECISKWLKDCNHKCPVCKKSCGENKPLI